MKEAISRNPEAGNCPPNHISELPPLCQNENPTCLNIPRIQSLLYVFGKASRFRYYPGPLDNVNFSIQTSFASAYRSVLTISIIRYKGIRQIDDQLRTSSAFDEFLIVCTRMLLIKFR